MGGCHFQLWVSLLGDPSESFDTETTSGQVHRQYDLPLGNFIGMSYRCQELCRYARPAILAWHVRGKYQSGYNEHLLVVLYARRAASSDVYFPCFQRNGDNGRSSSYVPLSCRFENAHITGIESRLVSARLQAGQEGLKHSRDRNAQSICKSQDSACDSVSPTVFSRTEEALENVHFASTPCGQRSGNSTPSIWNMF